MIKQLYEDRFIELNQRLKLSTDEDEKYRIRIAISVYLHLMRCNKFHSGTKEPQCKELI